MEEEIIVALTAPWTSPFDLQGREFLESHGCTFEDLPEQQKTRITFPAGTTRTWDLRVGFVERFNLTLPDGLTFKLTYNTRFNESYLGFKELPFQINP